MDFLMLMSNRMVIFEIDGVHYYCFKESEGIDVAQPRLFAQMVAENK
jgi:hypothetical protein